MKRDEAVEIDCKQKQYLEQNKVRSIFNDLVRELVLKRPDDPIAYLINYLDKKPRKLTICLQGYNNQERKRLAKIISNKLNLKLIEVSELFGNKDYHSQNDATINEKVHTELKAAAGSVEKGILISGYPNNLQQIDYIQKCGILPDRYFVLPNDEAQVRNKLKDVYNEEQINNIIRRNQLQNKQLIEGLGETVDNLPLNVEAASEKLSATLSVKVNKKSLPYDSPRIIITHPPYLVPGTLVALVQKYSFHHVNITKSLNKLAQKQNFKDYVQKHIRQTNSLTKQIQLALIETQCRSAPAKNKGYVLSGWPKTKENLLFMKQRYLSPHLIFVFDLDPLTCEQNFQKLTVGDPQLFSVSPKPSLQQYKKQLQAYGLMVEHLKQHYKVQVLPLNQSEKQVLKTFQSLIDNPKIYS